MRFSSIQAHFRYMAGVCCLVFSHTAMLIPFGCGKEPTPLPEKLTVTDIDGNTYETVTIGTQTWMQENLKVTRYSNGDPIPEETDHTVWVTLTKGARCDYNNDADHAAIYGKLYNYYAAADPRNVCPTGWHVPGDDEWNTLTEKLRGVFVAGGKMKEAGTLHWIEPNSGATNTSGFTALPGGYRDYGFDSNTVGEDGYWWTTTEAEADPESAWFRNLFYNQTGGPFSGYATKKGGFSIRCLQD